MFDEFPVSARFEAGRRLGAGGFGVVYEAYDHDRHLPVALKVLRSESADALLLFKREFRALADLNHRNLVTLYELLADGPRWFFTMELLKGRRFHHHVWDPLLDSADAPSSSGTDRTTLSVSSSGVTPVDARARVHPPVPRHSVDYDRLRAALRQLADGLIALHDAGKLHRDIKPANVLVTDEGRVVLLDFGLVTNLTATAETTMGLRLAGTPAYMAPEQAAGAQGSPASDWYSVGVVMFEALTTSLPFTGSMSAILAAKQRDVAPLVRDICPDVPSDLADLCRDLLVRDPAGRATGSDVIARLGGSVRSLSTQPSPQRSAHGRLPFVGRTNELASLWDAFNTVAAGQAVTAYIRGASGMGKTMLARHFLRQLREREPQAVIVTGRCYQQESVPYKAFDLLIDELSQRLETLDAGQVEALLPRDVLALVRLFPVLKRVQAIGLVRRRTLDIPDPQELRRRAVLALRELLARIAEKWPLVIFIDDLQWSDLDSTYVVGELLRPPDPPPLLLLGAFRSDEAETSPALRGLLALHRSETIATALRDISLREFGPTEVNAIVASMSGTASLRPDLIELVHRESGGNPFFVHELARLAVNRGAAIVAGDVNLEQVIATRLGEVGEPAARLLKVLALAARPLETGVALRAAELAASDYGLLTSLRIAQLVRGRDTDRTEEIEVYHDRIREVVSQQIAPAVQAALHLQLGNTIEQAGGADPEALTRHFTLAGALGRAADHAVIAADRAAAALAFDRAARLYEHALRLRPEDDAAHGLQLKLADALANAGRGSAAGHAYLAAAEGTDRARFVELQRRAAEQFLTSGHMEAGLAALDRVLRRLDLRLARTPREALLMLLVRRTLIRLRGFGFRERHASTLPQNALLKIDSCWSVAIGLAFVDNVRAADFQARQCLMALRSGEPYRIARALALEAGYSATGGTRTEGRTHAIVRAALSIAERLQNPHAIGLASLTAGIANHLAGHWKASLEWCERADNVLRESCTGVTWEIDTTALHILQNLFLLGELTRLCDRLPALVNSGRERGDLYGATALQLRTGFISSLIRDDVDGAMSSIDSAERPWSRHGFLLQHYWSLMARLDVLAYQGQSSAAYELIHKQWPQLASAQLLRFQFSIVESHYRRARSALMCARDLPPRSSTRTRLLKEARRDAQKLKREGASWSVALGYLLEAGAANTEQRIDDEHECLLHAERCFDEAHMRLHVAVCSHARGRLLGGDEGLALIAQRDELHRASGIVRPAAFDRMFAGWTE